jgi:erythritol transport system ATP-binding protein
MGLHPQCRGTISIEGKEVRKASITERIKLRLALIPEDRQREGLIQPLTVRDNMILSSLRKYLNGVYLSKKKERTSVAQLIKQLSIKVSNSEALITSLSGGNQQKVVIAKGLLTSPKVLLMDEPTRGIDIGAKADVFKLMNELAASGLGIVFISSELREVIGMADRILVMSKGRITGEFTHAEATEEALVAASAVGHARPSQNQGEKNHE